MSLEIEGRVDIGLESRVARPYGDNFIDLNLYRINLAQSENPVDLLAGKVLVFRERFGGVLHYDVAPRQASKEGKPWERALARACKTQIQEADKIGSIDLKNLVIVFYKLAQVTSMGELNHAYVYLEKSIMGAYLSKSESKPSLDDLVQLGFLLDNFMGLVDDAVKSGAVTEDVIKNVLKTISVESGFNPESK